MEDAMLNDRQRMMLSALSAAPPNANFTPVEMQKMFFLLDKEAASFFGGPKFCFQPYDYGPFDRAVYDELDQLEALGFVTVDRTGRYKRYILTEAGRSVGEKHFVQYHPNFQAYARDVANWLLANSFHTIVSSIYARYPDMRANSVFRG